MLFNNWKEDLKPLLQKYKDKKHPLEFENLYQLIIAVILSAQDSDENVNQHTKSFFKNHPNFKSLKNTPFSKIKPFFEKINNFENKIKWILEIVDRFPEENNIPNTLNKLLEIKGIGRKSANVILREIKKEPQGIIVDLHVMRVVPRIGISIKHKTGNQMEKILIKELPYEIWNDIGMSLSFLGREICKPTNPICNDCPVSEICNYYKNKY